MKLESPTPEGTTVARRIVLVSPYDLGRQPFALAQVAAWLARAGHRVHCLDLSLQKLDPRVLASADGVALYLGMHTAARIALAALPRIRAMAPQAALAAFGLYAPMNAARLRGLGVDALFGGESEPDLAAWANGLGFTAAEATPRVSRSRIAFFTPDRRTLPGLERYAHLVLPDGDRRRVAFTEASRGCKHLCRHCPVVPVYEGRFRIVPEEIVLDDIAQQIAAGAQHVSFGDHDFLNGPAHAMKVVRALHARWPEVSFDATIKIQHLIQHAGLLPELRRLGCLFILSAVEALDDQVLEYLAKEHTRADFYRAVELVREAGIAFAPTWVAFHPWTTLESYLDLLRTLVELRLVEAVPPIQLAIRLLVPEGSWLLRLPAFARFIGAFDDQLLGYPWQNPDARVDALQREVQALVAEGEGAGLARREIFARIWQRAHGAAGRDAPALPADLGEAVPHLSEPWYCCAEPTDQQLTGFI